MIEPVQIVVQSSNVTSGPPGSIRYTVSMKREGGIVDVPNVQSCCAVDDGSGIDRKAAPPASAWPAFIVNGQLQAYIVELEASETCP